MRFYPDLCFESKKKWMDGWMDGWIDGWMDRQKEREKERKRLYSQKIKCLHWAQFGPPEINCFKGISVIVDSPDI